VRKFSIQAKVETSYYLPKGNLKRLLFFSRDHFDKGILTLQWNRANQNQKKCCQKMINATSMGIIPEGKKHIIQQKEN
jgi:hypothetical protein